MHLEDSHLYTGISNILAITDDTLYPEPNVDPAERLTAAQAAGSWFAAKVRDRDLQVRRNFIRRRQDRPDSSRVPPLATLMRGGRGGEVRLKLLLSLLWIGANPPHDVTFPARTWAELLGLDQPETKGARRIREAIDWLTDHKFIATTERKGQPPQLTLLREDGSGVNYSIPGKAASEAVIKGRGLQTHLYVRLPPTIWTNGWMAALSAPAFAALLILLVEQNGSQPTATWIAPEAARDRYALSDQTRYKGLAELEALDLVQKQRITLARSDYDFQRNRNTYTLQPERLNDVALILPKQRRQSKKVHSAPPLPASGTSEVDH